MSTTQQPRTFLITLATRATGSAGFARSLLAICTMWLLPELKPSMPYHHRKRASPRRTKIRSTPVTSSSPSTSTSPPAKVHPSQLQRPRLKNSRRSSLGVVLSNFARSSMSTSRKWSFSSPPKHDNSLSSSSTTSPRSSVSFMPSSSASDSSLDSDSRPSACARPFCRPRLSFPTRLPYVKEALSTLQGKNPVSSTKHCEPVTRSKTVTSDMLSHQSTKSPESNVPFTHPWPMSRSRTSATPSATPSEFITTKPSRLPFARKLSRARPTPSSPLASPGSTPPSYFSRSHHPRKESYSLYLRGLPRFEGVGLGRPEISSNPNPSKQGSPCTAGRVE